MLNDSDDDVRSHWISHYVAFVLLLVLWAGSAALAPPVLLLFDRKVFHCTEFNFEHPGLRSRWRTLKLNVYKV
jgi:hypothetical protein